MTKLSIFWFEFLKDIVPNHLVTTDMARMSPSVQQYQDQLRDRTMLVKKLKILPIEAIVRGYISGNAC